MNVVHAVAGVLRQQGMRELFGVLGAGNLAFVNCAVDDHETRYHSLRHEAAAVAAADAYARTSGQLGIATVTHGPGLTHATSAIVEAVKSRVQLLVVTGAVGKRAPHRNQAINQVGLVQDLGAHPVLLTAAADATELVRQAISRALLGQPTVLMIPDEIREHHIAQSTVEPVLLSLESIRAAEAFAPSTARDLYYAANLDHAARLLMAAERPVILAGRGAMQPETIAQLRLIGRRIGALLLTTLPAKDRFAGDDFDAGICGSFGDASSMRLVQDADVALVVGSSLSSWTTRRGQLFTEATLIRCDDDPGASAVGERVFLPGDAQSLTAQLASLVRPTGRTGYRTPECAATLRANRNHVPPEASDSTGLDPRTLIAELAKRLPPARSVVVDGGHFSGWPAMLLTTPPPGLFVYAHGFQCVGLALGNVVGAALGAPETLPIAFIGDGGLLMSLGELHSLAELELPVLVVVLNDGAYGAEYHQSAPHHAGRTLLRRQDFAQVTQALGGTGVAVRRLSDLDDLSNWLDAPAGLCLLDCHVTRSVRADWLVDA